MMILLLEIRSHGVGFTMMCCIVSTSTRKVASETRYCFLAQALLDTGLLFGTVRWLMRCADTK